MAATGELAAEDHFTFIVDGRRRVRSSSGTIQQLAARIGQSILLQATGGLVGNGHLDEAGREGRKKIDQTEMLFMSQF